MKMKEVTIILLRDWRDEAWKGEGDWFFIE
jgi:hypothetical protein